MDKEMQRLYEVAKTKGIKGQSALARLLNVSPQTVNNWECRGISERGKIDAHQKLGVSIKWIETGVGGAYSEPSNVQPAPQEYNSVPLISWVQAGDWAEIIDEFNPGDADEWVTTFKRHSKNSFAVRVEGISMQNHGHKESFDPGDIILADPERAANNGSLVIVRLEDEKEATFKKLYIESGQYYLKPLNPDWRPQIIPINGNTTICGVVFQKVVDFT